MKRWLVIPGSALIVAFLSMSSTEAQHWPDTSKIDAWFEKHKGKTYDIQKPGEIQKPGKIQVPKGLQAIKEQKKGLRASFGHHRRHPL